MIELEITASDLDALKRRAQQWPRMVKGELLKGVAELTVRQAKERVRTTKHTPDGKRWAPRKSGGNWPLMFKTRAMANSIRRRRVSADEYRSGAEVPYAVHHHTGTARMEARPFIGVGITDTPAIEKLIETFVELHF